MRDYVNSTALQEYTTKLVAKLKTLFPGTPTAAATVADMTDHSKTYVYVGSETGYTTGDWYYWNGTAWTSGGPFQATSIITDTTLAVAGEAADAKATGDAIADAKAAVLNAMAPAYSTSATYAVGDYVNYNGSIYRCTTAITTAESWTSGHWTAVVLGADLASQVSDLKTQLTDYNAVDLIKGLWIQETFTASNGTVFTWDNDHYVITGASTPKSAATFRALILSQDLPVNIKPEHEYYLKFQATDPGVEIAIVYKNSNNADMWRYYNSNDKIVVPPTAVKFRAMLLIRADVSVPENTIVSEFALLSAITNADADEKITDIAGMVAAEFSNSVDYNEGDYVIYNDNLYRFQVFHEAGEWNAYHVLKASAAENINTVFDCELIRSAAQLRQITQFSDIPTGRYIVCTLEKIMTIDNNFPFDLPNITYLVTARANGNIGKRYDIMSLNGTIHYAGYKAGTGNPAAWNDISGYDTAEAMLNRYNVLKRIPMISSGSDHGMTVSRDGTEWKVYGTATGLVKLFLFRDWLSLPTDHIRPGQKLHLVFTCDDPQLSVWVSFNGSTSAADGGRIAYGDTDVTIPADAVSFNIGIRATVGATISEESPATISLGLMTRLSDEGINDIIDYKAKDDIAFELYSKFDEIPGWYSSVNERLDGVAGHYHTNRFRIRPNTDYYMAHIPAGATYGGTYYDIHGNYLRPLYVSGANNDFTAIGATRTGESGKYNQAQVVLPDNCVESVTRNGESITAEDPNKAWYKPTAYMYFYKFTTPENAAYLSFNLDLTDLDVPASTSASTETNVIQRYRNCIASKLMFLPYGYDNIVIRESDPAMRKYKGKKLCVIGPSTVMIDRLFHNGKTVANPNPGYVNPGVEYVDYYDKIMAAGASDRAFFAKAGYTAGFQEILEPYFDEIRTYGFSGAPMARSDTGIHERSTRLCPIVAGICGGESEGTYITTESGTSVTYVYKYDVQPEAVPDLSGYDVFLITADANGTIGLDGTVDYENETEYTYIGALKSIVEKIYADNPYAEIYIGNFNRIAQNATHDLLNTKIARLTHDYRCTLVDLTDLYDGCRPGMTITENGVPGTWTPMSYDDKHRNNRGNLISGLAWRKAIMGF